MKKIILNLIAFLMMIIHSNAQIATFDSEAIAKDFVYNLNIYADGFIGPVLGTYSPAQVASNHITAKTLKPFAIGFGISGSGTFIDDSEVEFNFNEKPFSDNMTLSNPTKPILPSIIGGNTTAELVYKVEGQLNPPLGGSAEFEQKLSALDGLTAPSNAVPAAAINLSLGLPLRTEVFVRALPEIDFDGLENYLVGGGAKHVISQYFQDEDNSHFHVAAAAFAGKSKFTFIPEQFLDGENQEITFTDNTYSGELIASYDRRFFSIFGLVGFYSGSSEFAINGTYRYNAEQAGVSQEVFNVTNPIILKRESSGVQTQVGASVNFSTMGSFALTYAMAESNSVAFNLRFYINNGE